MKTVFNKEKTHAFPDSVVLTEDGSDICFLYKIKFISYMKKLNGWTCPVRREVHDAVLRHALLINPELWLVLYFVKDTPSSPLFTVWNKTINIRFSSA